MADTVPDSSATGRGEQPLYAPVHTAGNVPPGSGGAQEAPPPDGPGPGYTAPYPPYPYDGPPPAALSDPVAAGLAYVTIIPAVCFLLLEPYRRNALVRFHSWQSIFLFVGIAVVRTLESMLVAMMPSAIAFAISGVFSLLFMVAWLMAMIKAFQGSMYQLPVVGAFAASTASSSSVE